MIQPPEANERRVETPPPTEGARHGSRRPDQRIAAGDLLVHGWDLSQATGQGFQPPQDVVGEIEGFYRVAIGPELRAGGSFGEPVEVAPDAAPLERLVAFAGRQP